MCLERGRLKSFLGFDIKGFRTSLCNRTWRELHPPARWTAAYVERFIQLGAIVLGKAKLKALIVREDSIEYIDFFAPSNPRADGY